MTKKKLIYLHIGYNKTGTTAIQSAFYNNGAVLAKHGIFYPVKCRGKRKSPAHHSLAESLLFRIGKPLPHFVKTKVYSKYPQDYYLQLLEEELSETACQTVFISSEAFSRFRGHPDLMKFVKEQLSGYQVKILVYLRNQVEYFESAYNQAVKRNGETRTVDEMMKSGWLSMDYFEEIEQWASVFGPENIIVRIYDRDSFSRDGVVGDVCEAICIGKLSLKNKIWWVKTNWNIRLPNNMVETKRNINAAIRKPKIVDNLINFLLHWAGNFFDNVELLSPKQKDLIRNHFYESNVKLGRKYFDGRYPFI